MALIWAVKVGRFSGCNLLDKDVPFARDQGLPHEGLQTFAGQCAKSIPLLPVRCDQLSPTRRMLSRAADRPSLESGNPARCVKKSILFTAKMIIGAKFIVLLRCPPKLPLASCIFYRNKVVDRSETLCSRAE